MFDEYDELSTIAGLWGSSMSGHDNERFKKFLRSTKESKQKLTLGNFRDVFEKFWVGRNLSSDEDLMIVNLYEKYVKIKK